MRISIFGLGYVGAVSCACLTELGHSVIGIDINDEKIDRINAGRSPVLEPGLDERIAAARARGCLEATAHAPEAVCSTEVGLLCVGTPSTSSGGVNAEFLENVVRQIGEVLRDSHKPFFAVLNRSTSLAPTHHRLQALLTDTSGRSLGDTLGYACHPEFLREGMAVEDFYDPPKIVFGATDARTRELCGQLYPGITAPTFFTTPEVASMVKYADNGFHAVKVAFANEIGMICQRLGIDAQAVMDVFCQDTKLNISSKYLRPGAPFGGSCLPKDLRALLDAGRETATPLPMLSGVLKSNALQVERLLHRILSPKRPTVGIVGLAFKEHTDDVRESPMVALVEQLSGKGHPVRIYDRHLATERLVGANRSFALMSIPHLADLLTQDLGAVVETADILVVNHQLSSDEWRGVRLRPTQRVIDLCGVTELAAHPGYEGLYW